jgi:hypothetical protein
MKILKLLRPHNSVGLINCLLQPGLFYLRIQRSMREEFNSHIKSCATWTVPATETKSIGLQADARVVMVFATPPRHFYRDTQFTPIYRDLVPSRQITVTLNFSAICQDLQKPRHHDADGTSPNRRAVMVNSLQLWILDYSQKN